MANLFELWATFAVENFSRAKIFVNALNTFFKAALLPGVANLSHTMGQVSNIKFLKRRKTIYSKSMTKKKINKK